MKSHFLAEHIGKSLHELHTLDFELNVELHHSSQVNEHLQELLFLFQDAFGLPARRLAFSNAVGN